LGNTIFVVEDIGDIFVIRQECSFNAPQPVNQFRLGYFPPRRDKIPKISWRLPFPSVYIGYRGIEMPGVLYSMCLLCGIIRPRSWTQRLRRNTPHQRISAPWALRAICNCNAKSRSEGNFFDLVVKYIYRSYFNDSIKVSIKYVNHLVFLHSLVLHWLWF